MLHCKSNKRNNSEMFFKSNIYHIHKNPPNHFPSLPLIPVFLVRIISSPPVDLRTITSRLPHTTTTTTTPFAGPPLFPAHHFYSLYLHTLAVHHRPSLLAPATSQTACERLYSTKLAAVTSKINEGGTSLHTSASDMDLRTLTLQTLYFPSKHAKISPSFASSGYIPFLRKRARKSVVSFSRMYDFGISSTKVLKPPCKRERQRFYVTCGTANDDEPLFMDEVEREEWRRKIREVIDMNPNFEEEVDPIEKRKKMQQLLADYPLVVNEDDPDWPDDADDGHGFSLDQFFNKITIKNNANKNDDDDDVDKPEIVWEDDNYIRPVKDITSVEWEETVFKDISPLIVLVHNRYRRPTENEKTRDQLEKSIQIIWNCRLPAPRCVAIDAVVERDLVSALKVSVFPELIFTKAGKILYREKGNRTADELSKIMAFFYFGAAKPPFLNIENEEAVPTFLGGH